MRINYALRRAGATVEAGTVHSLLEIRRNGHDGQGWGFARGPHNPLDVTFLVVEEASMLDTQLCGCLLSACAPGTHVLFVGDPHQLPPVGHGAPLRDLIAAGVPCGRLSEIRRNAGAIVRACADIKDGKDFKPDFEPNNAERNLQVIPVETEARQLQEACKLLGGLAVMECQAIVGTNAGTLGRHNVNRALRDVCNKEGSLLQAAGNPFWPGDKLICLRNGLYPTEDGREAYIANGEIGTVDQVQPRYTLGRFFGPERLVRVPVIKKKAKEDNDEDGGATGDGGDFDLGYAITCHKSQGSEWPVVVVLIDPSPGAKMVCGREWLYTAISRASGLCVLVGRLGVAQMMTRRPSLHKRKTFLRELIRAQGTQ